MTYQLRHGIINLSLIGLAFPLSASAGGFSINENSAADLGRANTGRVTSIHDASVAFGNPCLLYTSPSPRDGLLSRMPSSA